MVPHDVSEPALTPSDSVRMTQSDDGAVLLDIQQGLCFSLNPVAALIWNQLRQGGRPTGIAQHLAKTFDISEEQAAADVQELLQQLKELHLLRTPEDANPKRARISWLKGIARGFWGRRSENGAEGRR